MITIKPLTHTTLATTIELACSIFPHDDPEKIALSLTSNLVPETFEQRMAKYGAANVKFWVALENKKVVGFVGYYVLQTDFHEAAWLSWYGVAPNARGRGLGLRLLEMVIREVKALGKTYLRLYTSAEFVEEKRAQEIYKKRGFVTFDGHDLNRKLKLPANILYFQLALS